jgi:hypothetical protein
LVRAESDEDQQMPWSSIAGIVAVAFVVVYLARKYRRDRERNRREPARFFAPVAGVLQDERFEDTGTVGYPRLAGTYRQLPVQILPVIDTLQIRRLPAIWLLVTIQDALPITSRIDLMMRPAGATTFSNFDLLPYTLVPPSHFPEHAVVRSDAPQEPFPLRLLEPHLDVFRENHAKELLITPSGLRMVWLLAEADRARYGVFRQAEFGGVSLNPELVRDLLERLCNIRASLLEHCKGHR